MRNYNFLKTSMDFEYVLVGHSFVHPISYLQEVEAFLRTNEFEGYILLDGLLSNGFSDNRFAKVFFDGKRFDMMNIDLGAQKLELLPLAEYSSRGFKGLVMQHLNCMGLHELQDNRVDLSAYEHVYVDNPSQGAEVLFSSNTSLESFEVLDLQGDSSRVIYSKGLLNPEEKLVLHLESFETDPELDYETVIKNGICFRDDTGSLRKFAIRAKVMDGSVYLEEID